jgi:hypothetical protein
LDKDINPSKFVKELNAVGVGWKPGLSSGVFRATIDGSSEPSMTTHYLTAHDGAY